MEKDSIRFKNDTMQEENHAKPEISHQNNTSIEIDTKPQENKEKDQIEDSVKAKGNEKEQSILLPIINSPKKTATKQPQIRNTKNNTMQKITQKTPQKTFAEDSRLNKSSIENSRNVTKTEGRGDRYQDEPRLKFLEFEKGPEPRKKTPGSTSFLPFHLSKGTSNPANNNRNNSLPPLNNKGDESVTPSDNISQGSFIIAGNFQSANVSCIESQYNNKDNSPNDDESVDLTRLNNILRAKLKPGSRAKLLEESEIEDTDNFIPKLYEKYMVKNNGKGFALNVSNTPYMDHLPNKGRGFSAKKGNERYLPKPKKPAASLDKRQNLTENNYTSDEDSTLIHSKNIQRLYNKSQGIPEELPPRLNTSENRTRSIKRVYNAAYLENKKPPKNNVQSIVKATINSKNPFSLGAASNLIKPEVQPTQEKSKRIVSKTHLATPNSNPWDSMSSDKAKVNSSTTGNIAKKRSSSVIGDIKGSPLASNPSGVLTPKKSFKYLTQSRSGSEEKLARMDSHSLVRQAYRVKPKITKDDPNTR